MPFGYSPVGADPAVNSRLIVELSMELGQGRNKKYQSFD